MKRKIDSGASTVILAVGFILLAVSISAIDLEEYVELVKANHPFFHKEELAVEVEQSYRETLLPRYEWQFSLMPQYSFLGEAGAADYQADLAQFAALELGTQRSFADGKRLGFSVSTEYNWLRFPSPTDESSLYKHGIGASLSWPLLKNAERLARLGYDLQEYTIMAKEVEIKENQESFLMEPAILFIDWAYALELAAIYRQRLVLAEEQAATTNRMFQANLVEKLDVLRAEDAIRMARQGIIEYESLAKSIQAVLATLSDSEYIYNDTPDVEFYSLVELPEAAEAAARVKADTRLKKPLSFIAEQLRYQSEAFREREKATLDLFLEAGIYGRADTSTEPDDAFVQSLKIIHPQATIGLSYSPATGLDQVEADRQFINTQIRQLDMEIRALEKTVETNVISLLIQAAELEKVIEVNRELIESAEEKAVEEARLYSQGRNTLTNVIQSRDGVQDQRAKLVDNFARYHRLIVQYRALMDELLE